MTSPKFLGVTTFAIKKKIKKTTKKKTATMFRGMLVGSRGGDGRKIGMLSQGSTILVFISTILSRIVVQ